MTSRTTPITMLDLVEGLEGQQAALLSVIHEVDESIEKSRAKLVEHLDRFDVRLDEVRAKLDRLATRLE